MSAPVTIADLASVGPITITFDATTKWRRDTPWAVHLGIDNDRGFALGCSFDEAYAYAIADRERKAVTAKDRAFAALAEAQALVDLFK